MNNTSILDRIFEFSISTHYHQSFHILMPNGRLMGVSLIKNLPKPFIFNSYIH